MLANNGDDHFVERLNTTLVTFQEKTGYEAKFEMLDGGRYLMQENFIPTRHFLPDDYNQTAPLKQWSSQKPLGHQIIFQMEVKENSKSNDDMNELSEESLRDSLREAISASRYPGIDDIRAFATSGDGCLLVAVWSAGSVIVVWDGRGHVDLNLFTYEENNQYANELDEGFRSGTSLETRLRDEQPRGIGRVVSYFGDLEGNDVPHWA